MKQLIVVDRRQDWPYATSFAAIVSAREYLTDPAYGNGLDARVVNLCRFERYQGRGYYVSLLAEARGHRPLPEVKTIEDLQSQAVLPMIAQRLEAAAEQALSQEKAAAYQLDSAFGFDLGGCQSALARELFALLRVPLLRARFVRRDGHWRLQSVGALAPRDMPPSSGFDLQSAAAEYLCGNPGRRTAEPGATQASVAILCSPGEPDAPSNPGALEHFGAAAHVLGLRTEIIGAGDIARLAEFDGLFIRATTSVGHFTYEFSRRASALGLVVVDDPDSIVKCTNKVYLSELMSRHRIPTPKSVLVHRDNVDQVVTLLGLPCILKQPDGAFSLGVTRIESAGQLQDKAAELFERSELLVAQEWLPTAFDWRVCVFDRRPLFACRYYMAPGHWQIIKRETRARVEGRTVALSIGEAPAAVVRTAVRAANLIGDGLYGVDVKEVDGQCYLIEVNDNPNIDAGGEDQVLGGALYREVMGVFARRIFEVRRTQR